MEASPQIASELITARCAALVEFPQSGAAREQLAAGLRVIFCRLYAIYYRPLADVVGIIQVVHGARDIAAIASEGGFA